MKLVSPSILGVPGLLDGHLGPLGSLRFTPRALSPTLWLRPGVGVFQSAGGSAASADGDLVGQWQDQSGNNNHVTQTGTARPSLQLAEQNGLPTLYFDGTDDCFILPSVSMSPCSFFVVTKMDDNGNNRGGWLGRDGVVTNLMNDQDRYIIQGGSTVVHANSAPTAYSLVEFHLGASGYEIVENGVTVGSGATTFSGTFDRIGKYATRFFKGFMGELVFYPAMKTGSQRGSVRTYLGDNWGIAV